MLQIDLSPIDINPCKTVIRYREIALNYAQLDAVTLKLAEKLISVSLDNKLAIRLKDPLFYALAVLAALRTELRIYLLHPKSTEEEIRYLQNQGTFCVTDELITSWNIAITTDVPDNQGQRMIPDFCACSFVFSTSNTTSTTNLYVEIPSNALLVKAEMLRKLLNILPNDITYLISPMSFIQSFWTLLVHLMSGATVILDNFSVDKLIKAFSDYQITTFVTVPSIARTMCRMMRDIHSLRLLVLGGDYVDKELINKLPILNKNLLYANVYGCTETSAADLILAPVSVSEESEIKYSIGTPGYYSTITVQSDTKKEARPYEKGQLYINGPYVIEKYLNQDHSVKSYNGFCTGDIVYKDSKGYYYYCGRTVNIIKYNGMKISALEIEHILLAHPKVSDTVVLGFDDSLYGQIPVCFLCLNSAKISLEEIIQFLGAYLEQYKIPKKFIVIDSIPKTNSGKTVRNSTLYEKYMSGDEGLIR